MGNNVYSIRVTLERLTIHDPGDICGEGEIYALGSIDGHSTGRSSTVTARAGATISLRAAGFTQEVVVRGKSEVRVQLNVWDEDLLFNDSLGTASLRIRAPWDTVASATVRGSRGKFDLVYSIAHTVIVPGRTSVGLVSRQHSGSSYATVLATPRVAFLQFSEIRGLYKPGVDDRAIRPAGTTKNSGYVPGYTSDDDRGRIFRNRALDGSWAKDRQFIELTVEVLPTSVAIPAGTKVKWSFRVPDDPTNEGPGVHVEAGKILDPNDYTGVARTGANPDDNDPNGVGTATTGWEQVDPLYALAGDQTAINIPNRKSKVRFKVSDVLSDHYVVKAALAPGHGFDVVIPAETGLMTVWERVELEYVKMASAAELPVDRIAQHYDIACTQVDVSIKRVVHGASNKAHMGATDAAADRACDKYASRAHGEFTKEGTGGWFFIVAARHFRAARTAAVMYEGLAAARGGAVRLPAGTVLSRAPAIVRVFNPAAMVGVTSPWPNDRDRHIKFRVRARAGDDLLIQKHDFHLPDDPDNAFLMADLSDYGFSVGASIQVQVLSDGDAALVVAGISPGGANIGPKHYFGGRLLVFTRVMTAPEFIGTLCHELCHAFDNAHKCGNWDWKAGGTRKSCCMNYWFQFVLDNATPRTPTRWTQNRQSADLCAPHIRRMRDYHLEENPGLGW
jgi:hypothetical protein